MLHAVKVDGDDDVIIAGDEVDAAADRVDDDVIISGDEVDAAMETVDDDVIIAGDEMDAAADTVDDDVIIVGDKVDAAMETVDDDVVIAEDEMDTAMETGGVEAEDDAERNPGSRIFVCKCQRSSPQRPLCFCGSFDIPLLSYYSHRFCK
ncbi:hypothetical protein ACROYT_G015317 [Oculina patagonica]